MSVTLYMDHHIHAAVTAALRQRGVDVLTVFEDARAASDDEILLGRAQEIDRPLYTQDEDFLILAEQWLATARDFPGVIYSRQLGITIGQAVRDLELIAKVLDAADLQNRILFIPLSKN